MKAIKILFFVICTIVCLTGCKFGDQTDYKESAAFMYFARKANFMWADNIREEIVILNGKSGRIIKPLKNGSEVKSSEYILGFSTCNKDVSDIPSPEFQKTFLSDNYDPLYQSPHMVLSKIEDSMADEADPIIENIIKQYLNSEYSRSSDNINGSLTRAFLVCIDYRLTPINNIKITSSKDIFGIKAGEVLNDYFVIDGYQQYHQFIITSDKRLIANRVTDISIEKYLSYKPLAPAAIYFKFKDGMNVQSNVTAEFTIELELEDKQTISATTKPVTLTP